METKEQLQDIHSQLEVIRTIIIAMNDATFDSAEHVKNIEWAKGSLREAYHTMNICFNAIGNVEDDISKIIETLN